MKKFFLKPKFNFLDLLMILWGVSRMAVGNWIAGLTIVIVGAVLSSILTYFYYPGDYSGR